MSWRDWFKSKETLLAEAKAEEAEKARILAEQMAAAQKLLEEETRKAAEEEQAKREKEMEEFLKRMSAEKEEATAAGKPWVGVLNIDVNFENLSSGNFELDWNDQFIARLLKAGYQGKTDADVIDQWFTSVCRNIVLETYEQAAADRHPVRSRKLDDGRREYN